MELSRHEKEAFIATMLEVAVIDGALNITELLKSKDIAARIDAPAELVDEIFKLKLSQEYSMDSERVRNDANFYSNVIIEMNREKSEYFVQILIELAEADGSTNSKERNLIDDLKFLAFSGSSNVQKISHQIKSNSRLQRKIGLNFKEQLSLIRVMHEVIHADKKVDQKEMVYVTHILQLIDFANAHLYEEAIKLNFSDSMEILNGLSSLNKSYVSIILSELAEVDGYVDPRESNVLSRIFYELKIY